MSLKYQWLELLYLLVLKELKVRYKRSWLGYVWAIANPFMFALVYWVAFKLIMRVPTENYIVFLLSGIFPWRWLSQGVIHGTGSFIHNLSLVRRVSLPKLILPLSHVVQEMVHFICAIPVIFFFMIINKVALQSWSFLWGVPLMVLLQILWVFPLAVIGAVCHVYVRDVEYLLGILFSILFYLTPMVYPLSMVPSAYQPLFKANPAYWLIDAWRLVLVGGDLTFSHMINIVGAIVVFSAIAISIYRRMAPRIGELV